MVLLVFPSLQLLLKKTMCRLRSDQRNTAVLDEALSSASVSDWLSLLVCSVLLCEGRGPLLSVFLIAALFLKVACCLPQNETDLPEWL